MSTINLHYVYLVTLFVPALLAVLVFKKAIPAYRPMLIFLVSIFILELIQTILIVNFRSTTTVLNIQHIAEAFLICWQAKNWGVFTRRPKLFPLIPSTLFSLWVFEVLVIQDSWGDTSWFRVVYSFTITLLAIELLNRTMISERGPIFRNTIAVFSIALIFFYALNCLMEIIMMVGQYASPKTIQSIYYFYITLSIITNFIYIRAILCIPRNTNYSLS